MVLPFGFTDITLLAETPEYMLFKALDCGKDKKCILKQGKGAQAEQILLREYKLLRALTTHLPGLLTSFRWEPDAHLACLVYDDLNLLPFTDLQTSQATNPHTVYTWASLLLKTIAVAHRLGVVHGRLNADHLLVHPNDQHLAVIGWSQASLLPNTPADDWAIPPLPTKRNVDLLKEYRDLATLLHQILRCVEGRISPEWLSICEHLKTTTQEDFDFVNQLWCGLGERYRLLAMAPGSKIENRSELPAAMAHFFRASPDALLIFRNHKIIDANVAAAHLFGFQNQAEMIGQSLITLSPEYQPNMYLSQHSISAHWDEVMQRGNVQFEWVHQRRDGSTMPCELKLIRTPIGSETLILAQIVDVSSKDDQQRFLRMKKDRLELALEGSQDGIWDWNLRKEAIYFSPRWKEMLGYEDDELANEIKTWWTLIHPKDYERVREAVRANLRGDLKQLHIEYRMRAKDQSYRWILCRGNSLRDHLQKAFRLAGSHTDITERKQAEARFRILFEQSSDAHLLIANGRVSDCNLAALRSFGMSEQQDLLGRNFLDLSSEVQPDGKQAKEKWRSVQSETYTEGSLRFEWTFRRRSGQLFPVEATTTPIIIDSSNLMLVVWRDITERKREEMRRVSQAHILKWIASGKNLDTVLKALALDIEEQLPNVRAMITLLDESDSQFLLGAAPSLPQAFRERVHGLAFAPHTLTCGDAAFFKQKMYSHKLIEDIAWEPFWDLVEEHRLLACWSEPIFSSDKRVLGTIALIYRKASSQSDEEQRILSYSTNLAGIAIERHQIEKGLLAAKEAAEEANRAKSRFLSNMSHELRTPLNAILGFSQLLNTDETLTPDQKKLLTNINRSGEHLLNLINDVLEMSKIEAGRTTLREDTFDLWHMLDNLMAMFEFHAKSSGLKISMNIGPQVPHFVHADNAKLRQILINLLSNAIKFTKQGFVTLTITILEKMPPLTDQPEALDRAKLRFAVRDSGIGISKAEQESLFSPFVQTESGLSSQQGTGLGLAICLEFARLMGGAIDVESTPGVGSEFFFEIPVGLVSQLKQRERAHHVQAIAAGYDQPLILIVEDQERNRELLEKMFKKVGFRVAQAEDGKQAIQQWKALTPDLIVMDKRMPVMDGEEAVRLIRQHQDLPQPKILALTASAFSEDRDAMLHAGCDAFISKPFVGEQVLETVANLLGIAYVYRNPIKSSQDINSVDSDNNPSENTFKELPKDLLKQVYDATILGDFQLIESLLVKMNEFAPEAAQILQHHLHRFEYDAILERIQ